MHMFALQEEKRRGIYCQHCGKPVHLSHSILLREKAIKDNASGHTDLQSRAFPARCKRCHGESVYSVNQIMDL